MKVLIRSIVILLLSGWSFGISLFAQSEKQDLAKVILSKDSLFWAAYNNCNIAGMAEFFADDIEFYHDKGGLTQGSQNLITTTKKNLCSNENFRLRRVVVEGSVKVFPLQNSTGIYGAILAGEHVFYILEKGKEQRLDGLAKFTHVWIVKDKDWKMSRILSYDHGPAPHVSSRKAVILGDNILDQFVGEYKTQRGQCKVIKEKDRLQLLIGNQKYVLFPQSENSFFLEERDMTFDFSKNEQGTVSKMTVRERGKIVDEATRR